jgi:glycerol-3-phosphate dehydrogenase
VPNERDGESRTPQVDRLNVFDRASVFDRTAMLDRLRARSMSSPFDVVVIGGGVTGLGCALDAAARGLDVALVEAADFGSGTSSKSSKLVHGGLRYLQQGEVRLVYEALRERERLRRNAPHLVEVLPFMIPILTKDGVISKRIARALGSAMWMYDLTGGWRIGRFHRRIRQRRALEHFPTMPADRLAAAYLYFDAEADDARLCLTIARSAADHGAVVVNRCPVVGLVTPDQSDRRSPSEVIVDVGGERISVGARTVVNATGVWADEIRSLTTEGRANRTNQHDSTIVPAKGVHVTVPWHKVRNDIAVVIPVPGDRRSLFLVPWGPRPDGTFTHTYVGTTDTPYEGTLDDPQCDADDIAYVMRALQAAVTSDIGPDDVTAVWSGLRPLVRAADASSERTADLSRRHRVEVEATGVVTVIGGKLTTYREMAEETIDAVVRFLGRADRRTRRSSTTRRLRLHGATRRRVAPGSVEHHLHRRYGSEAAEVLALAGSRADLAEPLVPGLPYLRAEAVWAARHEMVEHLDDVLERRTRAHIFDRTATLAAASSVAELLATELGWDHERTAAEIAAYQARCDEERTAAETRGAS